MKKSKFTNVQMLIESASQNLSDNWFDVKGNQFGGHQVLDLHIHNNEVSLLLDGESTNLPDTITFDCFGEEITCLIKSHTITVIEEELIA